MVVGAGPAGLQAAISAARAGHQVTVYEKEAQAGGQVRLAASVPNRAEFGDIVRNQLTECRRLGVSIEYGVGVWPGLVAEKAPDHVIVATGAEPQRPWWAPADAPNVCDVRDVLTGAADPHGDVVVVDEIGFHHATSVAELLADRGCTVEIVTPGMVVGQDLGITLDMENWWMRASAKGIVQSTDLVPMGIAGNELTLLHHPTGTNQTRRFDCGHQGGEAAGRNRGVHDVGGRRSFLSRGLGGFRRRFGRRFRSRSLRGRSFGSRGFGRFRGRCSRGSRRRTGRDEHGNQQQGDQKQSVHNISSGVVICVGTG